MIFSEMFKYVGRDILQAGNTTANSKYNLANKDKGFLCYSFISLFTIIEIVAIFITTIYVLLYYYYYYYYYYLTSYGCSLE